MLHTFPSKDALHEEFGQFLVDTSKKAIAESGRFTVGFSGGSAATIVCTCMNMEKFKNEVDFSKWIVFFCDERFVELTHADSNYLAIHDGLLSKIPDIDQNNVYKLDYSTGNVVDAASSYQKDLHAVFGDSLPRFDVLILGMGPDGHTCSLFPNHALLAEKEKWVASLNDSPKPPPERITFTLGVVNNTKEIVFIAMGGSKAENIRRATEEEPTNEVPVSLVKPVDGTVHWYMDTDAAKLLTKSK